MSTPHLSIANVTKRFGSHQALDGVSLDVAASEGVVILGPSGCGKTTLLRLIAGLEVPDAGEIWISGAQVSGPYRSLRAPSRAGHWVRIPGLGPMATFDCSEESGFRPRVCEDARSLPRAESP